MPDITEQQYRDSIFMFSQLYDPQNPQVTNHLIPFQKAYEKQQQDRALPLFPSDENAEQKTLKLNVDKYSKYFGPDGLVAAEDDFTFIPETGDTGKKADIVNQYIQDLSQTKERERFLFDELQIKPEQNNPDAIFEATKQHFSKIKRVSDARKQAADYAFDRAIDNVDAVTISTEIDRELDRELIPAEEREAIKIGAINAAGKINDLIKPQKAQYDGVINSINRKMNSAATEQDQQNIDSFASEMFDMPSWKRQLVLSYMNKQAKKLGEPAAAGKRFWQNFGESAGRLIKDMTSQDKLNEQYMEQIAATGDVKTSIEQISTPEQAMKYIDEQTFAAKVKNTEFEEQALEGTTERTLTNEESELIYDALQKTDKAIKLKNDLTNLERNVDPLTEFKWDELSTYLPTMGKGLGSTAVIMGALGATRGAALPFVIEGYSNLNYTRYRDKGYSPAQAREAGNIAAVIEGSLDMFNVGYLTRLAKLGSVLKGAPVADVVLKRLALRGVETAFVETGVEVVQEATNPVVGETLALMSDTFKDVPRTIEGDNMLSVEFINEMKDVMAATPEIAVSMFPLALFGAGLATRADFKNIKNVMSNAAAMRGLGIQEQDIVEITNLTETDADAASKLYKEAWSRRDVALAQEVAKTNNKMQQQDIQRVMTIARDLGIAPTFRKLGDKYIAEKADGTFAEFSNANDLYLSLQSQLINGLDEVINAPLMVERLTTQEENFSNISEQLKKQINDKIDPQIKQIDDAQNDINTLRKVVNAPAAATDDQVRLEAANVRETLVTTRENLFNEQVKAFNNARGVYAQKQQLSQKTPKTYAQLSNALEVYAAANNVTKEQMQNIETNVFGPNDADNLRDSPRAWFYLDKMQSGIASVFNKNITEALKDLDNLRKGQGIAETESDAYAYFLNAVNSKFNFAQFHKTNNSVTPATFAKRVTDQTSYNALVETIQAAAGVTKFTVDDVDFTQSAGISQAQLTQSQKGTLQAMLDKVTSQPGNSETSVVVVTPALQGSQQTQTLAEWSSQARDLFGVNVVFFKYTNPDANVKIPGFGGFYNDVNSTVYINVEAKQGPIQYLFGHEYGHFLQFSYPELYKGIKELILNNFVTSEKLAEYKEMLPPSYDTDEKKNVEFVNDYIGKNFADIEFLNKLKQQNAAVFGKFADNLVEFQQSVLSKRPYRFDRDVNNFTDINVNAMNDLLITNLNKLDQTALAKRLTPKPSPFGVEYVFSAVGEIRKLKNIANSLNPTLEDLAYIDAVRNTLTDIKNISSADIIEKAIESIDLLNATAKQPLTNLIKNKFSKQATLKAIGGEEKIANSPLLSLIVDTLDDAINTSNSAKINEIYNELFPESGIPAGNFRDNLIKYSLYKNFSNLESKTGEQLLQLYQTINQLLGNVIEGNVEAYYNDVAATASKAFESINTDQRAQDLTNKNLERQKMVVNGITHYTDSVTTFQTLLQKIFPAKQQAGKALTDEMQQIVDDVQNAFLAVNDDVTFAEQDLFNIIDNAYDFDSLQKEAGLLFDTPLGFGKARKTSVGRRAALYNFVDHTGKTALKVTIDGRVRKLSQSFAAYVLNIADQNNTLYNEQLSNKGFTKQVIRDIREKIDPKTEQIRKEIRARINKEYSKIADVFESVFGVAPAKPDEFFFPVIGKGKGISIQDKFEVTYSSGKMRSGFELIDDFSNLELDLDVNDQSVHLVSAFNSFMYESSHQRNMFKPINKMKGVLTDAKVRDAISLAYGTNTYDLLLTYVVGFENNGIKSSAISQQISQSMRNAMGSVARGVMGFKLSTFFVNLMSGLNTFMDSSLPMVDILRGYASAMLNTAGGIVGASDKYSKTINSPVMRRRMYQGANTLLQLSQTTDFADKPTWLKDVGRASLQPMSKADAYAGTVAAMAAYNAHYNVAKRALAAQGYTGNKLEDIASKEAEMGMVRTVNKTAQPTTIAGKSTWELDSNPWLRFMLMFMSETRKTLGLELGDFKKAYRQMASGNVGSSIATASRALFVYHVLLGSATYAMRGIIQDFMRPEDEDDQIWNNALWSSYMMLGPLGGFPMLGSIADSAVRTVSNALVEMDIIEGEKIRVYGPGPTAIVSVLDQPRNAFNQLMKLDESDTPEQDLADILQTGTLSLATFFSMIGMKKTADTLSGVSTISNVVEQTVQAAKARE